MLLLKSNKPDTSFTPLSLKYLEMVFITPFSLLFFRLNFPFLQLFLTEAPFLEFSIEEDLLWTDSSLLIYFRNDFNSTE